MQPNLVKRSLLVAAFLVCSTPVHAQQLLAEGSAFSTDYYLLKDVLVGGGLELAIARKDSLYALHFGAGRYSGHATRVGVPCGGMVMPGTCETPELLRDDARLILVAVGGSTRIVRRGKKTLEILALLQSGYASSKTRGLQSGGTIGGSELMVGASAGLRATWSPFNKAPFVVEARPMVGFLNPMFQSDDVDGYNIFNEPILFTRLTIGVSYKLPLKMHDLTPKDSVKK